MPAREDLMLSDEQKMYIEYRFNFNDRINTEHNQLHGVSEQFIGTV